MLTYIAHQITDGIKWADDVREFDARARARSWRARARLPPSMRQKTRIVALAGVFVAIHLLVVHPLFSVRHPQPSYLRNLVITAPTPPVEGDGLPLQPEPAAAPSALVANQPHRTLTRQGTSTLSPPPPSPHKETTRLAHKPSAVHGSCTETPAAALHRARTPMEVPERWRQQRETAFAQYVQLHRAFVSKGSSASTAEVPGRGTLPRRFLVVKPCCQLCNRVRVLISALALGILTDRAVLIEFDGGTGHGVCAALNCAHPTAP